MDQGALGTCTAFALAAAFQVERHRQELPAFTPSWLFIYYNERALQHEHHEHGVNLRAGLRALAHFGVCHERNWPYSETNYITEKKPDEEAYLKAEPHKIVAYHRITLASHGQSMFLRKLKSCLAERAPFVFAFLVHKSFESDEVKKTGVMPIPEPREEIITWHAVLAVGYDDHRKQVLVRNSWGENWGLGGYFWMPYEYIDRPEVTADFWTISGVTG